MPQEVDRDYFIQKGLDLFQKHYKACLPVDSDTNLTPEAILTIFCNAFEQDAINLQKHEINELLESEGYKSRLVGQTLYWVCKTVYKVE
ncbi:MAG TPA: hypothetical protein VLZ75_03020 [Chitinophagales bacterium]|nr:hypothetical protein [Chitinophagales bacterium]